MKRLLPVVLAVAFVAPLSAQGSKPDVALPSAAMGLMVAAAIGAGFIIYLLPTIIAVVKKKQNTAAIALVNILLGWSFIGWVVALVWAVTVDAAPIVVQKAPAAAAPAPAVLCSACGKYNVPTARFCSHCAAALPPSAAQPGAP